jgi:hypothetical protein
MFYPGSGSDHCFIPDPGGKKAPDPQHWFELIPTNQQILAIEMVHSGKEI